MRGCRVDLRLRRPRSAADPREQGEVAVYMTTNSSPPIIIQLPHAPALCTAPCTLVSTHDPILHLAHVSTYATSSPRISIRSPRPRLNAHHASTRQHRIHDSTLRERTRARARPRRAVFSTRRIMSNSRSSCILCIMPAQQTSTAPMSMSTKTQASTQVGRSYEGPALAAPLTAPLIISHHLSSSHHAA